MISIGINPKSYLLNEFKNAHDVNYFSFRNELKRLKIDYIKVVKNMRFKISDQTNKILKKFVFSMEHQ